MSSLNKRMYCGNLSPHVSKPDLIRLLGLETTPYLRSSCWVEFPTKPNGQCKGHAFVNVPEHVADQLMKFNGIDFYGRPVVIEPAKDTEENGNEKEKKEPRNIKKGGPNRKRAHNGARSYPPPRNQKYRLPVFDQDQVMSLIDSGVNLTNGKFAGKVDYVVARALSAGVERMIVTGNRLHASRGAIVMARTRPKILFAAVGIHPHFTKQDWKDKTADSLEDLIKSPEAVAVGEVGLDFYRDYSPRDVQKKVFEKQVELACKYSKPLLVHDREAHDAVTEILEKFGETLPPVVIHCFTGTTEEAKDYVAKGYYIGITGYICKEKYGKDLRDAIKDGSIPLERIVVQTDGPYMIPSQPRNPPDQVSFKLISCCEENCNEPCTLSVIVKCIAHCLGKDAKETATILTENAEKVFGFGKPENY